MKIAIIYDTDTGNTKKMAEIIMQGANSVQGIEAKTFSMNDYSIDFLSESKCVIVGTPTYMTSLTSRTKKWLEELPRDMHMSEKMGGAFATAAFVHGGGDIAIRTILDYFMCIGMLTYSGGGAYGQPIIHLGPVAIEEQLENYYETFTLYGERMAKKALEIFG